MANTKDGRLGPNAAKKAWETRRANAALAAMSPELRTQIEKLMKLNSDVTLSDVMATFDNVEANDNVARYTLQDFGKGWELHAHGCKDVTRKAKLHYYTAGRPEHSNEGETALELIQSFFDEEMLELGWGGSDVKVLPCCKLNTTEKADIWNHRR